MTKRPQILDLISGHKAKPLTIESIINYEGVDEIYHCYLKKQISAMASKIWSYGEFNFFRDLLIFLKNRCTNPDHAHISYTEMWVFYYNLENIQNVL